MPLRYIRKRLTAENALSVAVTTTAVTRELADILQFPLASAAAGLLLLIFRTIQEMQANRVECYRLASRCLTLLTDLREAMEGRWEDAPPSLLRSVARFEQLLQDIYRDFKQAAEHKWHDRLLRKNSIETAIAEYNVRLADAARSFQIATLIHIHYAVDRRSELGAKPDIRSNEESPLVVRDDTSRLSTLQCDSPTSYASKGSTFSDGELVSSSTRSSTDEFVLVNEPSVKDALTEVTSAIPAAAYSDYRVSGKGLIISMLSQHDDRGFRRYHQSEIIGNGRSRITTGWWVGAREVTVEGRSLLLLPYGFELGSARKWIRDVKALQNVHHPSLPQMVGYSGTDAPTPFILLANVQTRLPQAMIHDAIQDRKTSLLLCTRLLIRFYKDVFDAAIYMQRQLDLTESKIQDYVEHADFRIDAQDTVVMGLPPPEIDAINSWRNFGLAHSIRDVFLQVLPNCGFARRPIDPQSDSDVGLQLKIHHLAVLAKALLPSSDDYSVVNERLQEILGDEEDMEESTLSLIRSVAIRSHTHSQTWSNNFVPAFMFTVGDIGYISHREDFKSFVLLRNIIRDGHALLTTAQKSSGLHTQWASGVTHQQVQPFPAHGDYTGWPIVLNPGARDNIQIIYESHVESVSAAWQFLLDHAASIAREYNVKPEELLLITRSGIDLRFVARDLRPNFPHIQAPRFGMQRPGFAFPGKFGGRQNHSFNHFTHQPPQPSITYLFTSSEEDQRPVATDTPVFIPLPPGAARPELRHCHCAHEGTYGFMNYVQLHAEDFL